MSLHTYASEDIHLHLPSPSNCLNRRPTILFFIPGNPGLLGYYQEFLSLLSTSPQTSNHTIIGLSLGGFAISSSPPPLPISKIQHPPTSPSRPLYTLRDQIDLTYARIEALVHALDQPEQRNVILIGHSVGAYIALEVIRRVHSQLQLRHQNERGHPAAFSISGAILLTPTVIDIAKSSHGRVVAPLLTYAPFVDRLVQWGVWGLVRTLPGGMLDGLVARITGMKGDKLETTMRWLRSEMGVRQTIYMGGQEMSEMGADTWGKEVWGVEEDQGDGWRVPKLVLYFARRDYWISDVTREEIIKARGRVQEAGKEVKPWPRIETEEGGELVHGWCIEQSNQVAEKVQGLIEEMIE